MPKHPHFFLFIALVFTPFISSCYGDLGTTARWNPPYIPMPKHSHFSLFIALVFTPFISSCYGDLGTAARWNPPYIPNACGFDVSQYPSNNIFAAAGEGIWNNGAACGRQYAVQCRSADAPGSCINGQTIQVMIVDRALTLTSQPSREGILMVISGTGFQAIANASATNINIDYKPS